MDSDKCDTIKSFCHNFTMVVNGISVPFIYIVEKFQRSPDHTIIMSLFNLFNISLLYIFLHFFQIL